MHIYVASLHHNEPAYYRNWELLNVIHRVFLNFIFNMLKCMNF
ncbi:hypothetical protein P262_02854 [Cronobacter malonaticus]|uniref:Uncharacterized protein n=1 Tax=Cronobacter malonaticus TaxID=413503 RepID=V5U0Q6_9ENTR|nr:hypothetical protein P262_02854 [Cronobacter malonaticus]